MKQLTCFYSICLATSLVFGGCQKENVQKKPAGLGTISVQKTGLDCCDDIQTVCNGSILRFNSIAHYDSVVACLDEAYDDWNDGYFAQYSPSDYTSDQMDSIDDAIGFVEEQPLDDFNTCMNFYSLRQHQNKLEDGWLDSTNMDTLQDPDIYFTEEDEVEATLYNKWSEIAIADTIYKLLPDGDVLMIFNFDCAAVMQLRDDPNYRCENVTILPIGSSDQCKAKKRLRCYDYYDGNKRMKSIHKHKIGFSFGEVAKTIHYKKKWGIWKRKRGDIRVRMTGFAYDMGCNLYTADQISETKGWDVRRKVKIRYKSSAHNWFKVENQVNYTVHEARLGQPPFQYGISRTVVLFW